MSNRLTRWANAAVLAERQPQRAITGWPSDWFTLANGMQWPMSTSQWTLGFKEEQIGPGFSGYVTGAYYNNPVVFACEQVRLALFSEARFQFRRLRSGRPGELFGNPTLAILDHPWPGATTGDLLARALQDADFAGNAFLVRTVVNGAPSIRRLRPDWVTIIAGSDRAPDDGYAAIDAEVLGYVYQVGGPGGGGTTTFLLPEQVAHFVSTPDPMVSFRGMSWITPVVKEIMGDSAASTHKLKFFENGATPNAVVSLDATIKESDYEKWVEAFKKNQVGLFNAYKTLYLGAGAKYESIGTTLRQVDFKVTQGAGETRIAAAAGVPPVIVGLSEGLQAATYSNYSQARRRFADGTMRPLWRNMAGSLERIVPPPDSSSQLWYDDRDIPFLQDDEKDRAEIQGLDAQAIRQLVDAGFEPATVVKAVVAGDLSTLRHTNLYSVQLQPPMPEQSTPATPAEPSPNGRNPAVPVGT